MGRTIKAKNLVYGLEFIQDGYKWFCLGIRRVNWESVLVTGRQMGIAGFHIVEYEMENDSPVWITE